MALVKISMLEFEATERLPDLSVTISPKDIWLPNLICFFTGQIKGECRPIKQNWQGLKMLQIINTRKKTELESWWLRWYWINVFEPRKCKFFVLNEAALSMSIISDLGAETSGSECPEYRRVWFGQVRVARKCGERRSRWVQGSKYGARLNNPRFKNP